MALFMCTVHWTYLASRFNSFPHTQVTDDPTQQQAQGHLPVYWPWFLQTIRNLENTVPGKVHQNKHQRFILYQNKVWVLGTRLFHQRQLSLSMWKATVCIWLGGLFRLKLVIWKYQYIYYIYSIYNILQTYKNSSACAFGHIQYWPVASHKESGQTFPIV